MSTMQNDQSHPIITITGERILLGPFSREFLSLYHQWANDFNVTRAQRQRLRPSTIEATERWYESVSTGDHSIIDFLLYEKTTLRPIGYATLDNINDFNRTATYGILIGEKDCWGKGYGTETTRLMLMYAFDVLGIHNIDLSVVDFNQRGLRAYERAGFRVTGRRRQSFRLGEKLHDLVSMECLAPEFDRSGLPTLGSSAV